MAKLAKNANELPAFERRFVSEYVKDFEPKKAAIRAGAYENQAQRLSGNLLKRPSIKAAVENELSCRRLDNEITVKRVLEELAAIAFFDIANYVLPNGDPIPLDEIPPEHRRALVGVDTKIKGSGEDAIAVTTYKLADKMKALEDMGKYLGLFRDQVDVNHTMGAMDDARLNELIDEFASEAGLSRLDPGEATAH